MKALFQPSSSADLHDHVKQHMQEQHDDEELTQSTADDTTTSTTTSTVVHYTHPDVAARKDELDFIRRRYPRRHARIGKAWNQLGQAYFHEGLVKKARKCWIEATQQNMGRKLTGIIHVNLAQAEWTLGNYKPALKSLSLAEEAFRAFAEKKQTPPEKDLNRATVQHSRGLVYTLLGRYPMALRCLGMARQIRQTVLGLQSLEVASSMEAIGELYLAKQEYQKAILCHEQALAIKEDKNAGRACVVTYTNLALVHQHRRDFETACYFYNAALTAQFRMAQEDRRAYRELAKTFASLGRMYHQAGVSSKAMAAMLKASQCMDEGGIPKKDSRRTRIGL